MPQVRSSPIVAASIAWLALVAACGHADSANDAGVDAGTPDAGAVWEYRTVELESGLVVDAWGRRADFDALPDVPTAAELCERFELAVTAVFEGANDRPAAYGASASSRAAPKDCEDQDFLCAPTEYFDRHMAPAFSGMKLPDRPLGPGYVNHPMGVAFYKLEASDAGTPLFTGVFDTRTAAPIAAFLHGGIDPLYYDPAVWTDATLAAEYEGPPVWARVVENPFPACLQSAVLLPPAMSLFFIEDLAQCGIIFGLPIPVNSSDATFEDHQWCPSAMHGRAVVLRATPEEHPLFPTECPRPDGGTVDYECYSP